MMRGNQPPPIITRGGVNVNVLLKRCAIACLVAAPVVGVVLIWALHQ